MPARPASAATTPPPAPVRAEGRGSRPSRRALHARAAIATEAAGPGRTALATLRSDPPLTVRRTGPAEVHLISTAAGPLGGDHLELDIDVAPGTTLDVRSVAATLVLPGQGPSLLTVTARVGPSAILRYAPEPTVLAAGCDHRMSVHLTLAPTASLYWREELVFGRHGESSGRCHTRFHAMIGDLPLLRQELLIGDPAVDGSPAVYAGARCVGSTLLAGPAFTATGPEQHPVSATVAEGVAVLPLAAPGTLVSALASDAVELRRRLGWGEARAAEPG